MWAHIPLWRASPCLCGRPGDAFCRDNPIYHFSKPADKQLSILGHPLSHLAHSKEKILLLSCFFSFFSCYQAGLTPQDSSHCQHIMVTTECQSVSVDVTASVSICPFCPSLVSSALKEPPHWIVCLSVLTSPWFCLITFQSSHIDLTVLWFLVNNSAANSLCPEISITLATGFRAPYSFT